MAKQQQYSDVQDLLFYEGVQQQQARQTAKQQRDEAIAAGFEKRLPQFTSDYNTWTMVTQHPDFKAEVLPALQNTGRGWMVSQVGPDAYKINMPRQTGSGFKTTDALLAAAADPNAAPDLQQAGRNVMAFRAQLPQYDPAGIAARKTAAEQAANVQQGYDPNLIQQALKDATKEVTAPGAVDSGIVSKLGQLLAGMSPEEAAPYQDYLSDRGNPVLERGPGLFASKEKKARYSRSKQAATTIESLLSDPEVQRAIQEQMTQEGLQRRLKLIRQQAGQSNV